MPVDLEQMIERFALTEAQAKKAIYIGINRTLRQVARSIMSETSKDTGVQLKIIRQRAKLHLARAKDLRSSLSIISVPVPLTSLGAKQGRRGVSYRGGRVRGAFIAEANGKKNVFTRRGEARYPLKKEVVPIARELEINFSLEEGQIARRLERNIVNQIERLGGLFS